MATGRQWHLVKAITVQNRSPDDADLRQLLHRAGGDPGKVKKVVHHVFLHLPAGLPVTSSGYRLCIGDNRIRQYVPFDGGITFRAHDASDVAALYGKPVRFVSDHGTVLDTGVKFPDLAKHLTGTVGHQWRKVYRR